MHRIDHQGIHLAAETFGDAADPAVLLVMGATASMLGWPDDFCAALAATGHFVIRFDHRDTGQSTLWPPGEADYALEDMAGDLLAVLDAFGIGAAPLVGLSLGGYLAQMVALTAPHRVVSLVLIGAEPLGWDGAPLPSIAPAFLDHFAGLALLDWGDRDAVAAFLVEIERLCTGSDTRFDRARAQAQVARVLAHTDSPASAFNHAALTARDDWTGGFRRIACPVLVIHGAEDPILPVGNGQALAAGIPGAELMILPDTGHEIPPRAIAPMEARIARHLG